MSWLKRRLAGGAGLKNYFGDGSDGDIRVTSAGAEQSFDGGVTWSAISGWTLVGTVVSIPSVQDGDMVVVNGRGLTIDSGYTLTVANRCRGLLIYAQGDVTINGALSMTARGCHANPADSTVTANTPVAPSDGNPVDATGIRIAKFADGETDPGESSFNGCGSAAQSAESNQPAVTNGFVLDIPRVGGPGGLAVGYGPPESGNPGGTLANAPGGGGSGAAGYDTTYPTNNYSGAGGDATCWSGGSGGGGVVGPNSPSSTDGDDYGGPGGDNDTEGVDGGGGAGNPAGRDTGSPAAEDGTGGLLIIVANGNLTVGASGDVAANGTNGGFGQNVTVEGGGGSTGGGLIVVLYSGTYTADGAIAAEGGVSIGNGGPGGAGSVIVQKIDAA